VEGSKISFYCRDNGNDVVGTCMKNGSWSPDPHTYRCQKEDVASIKLNLMAGNVVIALTLIVQWNSYTCNEDISLNQGTTVLNWIASWRYMTL
jgi:hypothetical protein